MDTISAQSLDLWGSTIHSLSIFLAPSTGLNVVARACSQEAQSLGGEKDNQSKDRFAISYLQSWNSKILQKPQIIFERLRFTCEATKPDWCLPGVLVFICPICDTGTFHCAFGCLGTCADPTPPGIKDKHRTTFPESADADLWSIANPRFGSGVADQCYRAVKASPEEGQSWHELPTPTRHRKDDI